MKIGILTLPLHTNYGGILQAYALQTVLEYMGHDVKVLSRDRMYHLTPFYWLVIIPSRLFRRLIGKKIGLFNEVRFNRAQSKIKVNVEPIIEQYIHRDKRKLAEICEKDYDCYIVGSDQIWRPKYIKDTLKSTVGNAFLEFTKNWNVKRIAYAASFGTDEWEYSPDQTKTIFSLAQGFKAISVREKSGVELCMGHLGVKAEQVLDPTMLLQKEVYIRAFNIENEPKSKGTLMTYILDYTEEKRVLVEHIAKDKGLDPFTVGAKIDDRNAPIAERIQPRLQKWLRGFYDAEFVVTDSFHACVFSILFGKPFIVIGNVERGLSRFDSLLALFGLEKNLISNIEHYNSKFDYTIPADAYVKLESYRLKSKQYLLDNLS